MHVWDSKEGLKHRGILNPAKKKNTFWYEQLPRLDKNPLAILFVRLTILEFSKHRIQLKIRPQNPTQRFSPRIRLKIQPQNPTQDSVPRIRLKIRSRESDSRFGPRIRLKIRSTESDSRFGPRLRLKIRPTESDSRFGPRIRLKIRSRESDSRFGPRIRLKIRPQNLPAACPSVISTCGKEGLPNPDGGSNFKIGRN